MDRVCGLTPQSLILNLQWLFWPYFFFCKYSILMIFGILNQLPSQNSMIYLAHLSHLSTNTALRCLSSFPWPHFQTAVPWPFRCLLHTLSPHDTIFTKHQASTPSGPMLLALKFRLVRLEFCFNASARAWQEANDLRNTMKHTAHIRMLHCFHTFWKAFPLVLIAQLQHPTAFHYLIVKNMRNLPVVLPIPISKCWFQAARTHETIKSPWVIKGTLHCHFATLCTFNEALVWGILELEFWTHQQIVANIWLFLWPGHPMVLPQANISLGALEKMPNRNLKIEQNSWKTRGLCMATCLWNHQRQLLTSTPWTEFAGWHHNHWSWTYNGFFDPISSFASIQFWWFSVSSISCHHRIQWYLRGGWTKAWLAREKEKGLIQALDVRRFKERVCEKLFQWPSSSHLCSKHLLQRVATFSLTCSTIAVLMRQPNAIVPGGDMPFIRFTSVHFGSTHSFLANKRWWWWWRWWWWRWWWGWWWRRIRSGSARARREGHQI